jgi:hypothetical protein
VANPHQIDSGSIEVCTEFSELPQSATEKNQPEMKHDHEVSLATLNVQDPLKINFHFPRIYSSSSKYKTYGEK